MSSLKNVECVVFVLQHIPKFMRWMKYLSFMYYGFRLLVKVQYSGDQLYECQSKGGCRTLQNSPSFDTVNLDGGLQEVWILLAMALGYRLCAYFCLRKRISGCHIWAGFYFADKYVTKEKVRGALITPHLQTFEFQHVQKLWYNVK